MLNLKNKYRYLKPSLVIFVLSILFLSGVYYSRGGCISSCTSLKNTRENVPFFKYDLLKNEDYVLVFLHIQKTGGSYFGRQLVKSLLMKKPCKCISGKKRCKCLHKGRNWIFSRFSTGWACGLHADWTELHECIDRKMNKLERKRRRRKYLYITNFREPVKRYLSEWKHTRRGATWKEATLTCQGKKYGNLIPKCYKGHDWSNVKLKEFYSCPYNLANNRQTRMMANLSLIDCYNSSLSLSVQEQILLNSAKTNLEELSFFALTEYFVESQFLFERTFNTKFLINFATSNETRGGMSDITRKQRKMVKKVNNLDVKLYNFAKKIFFKRYNAARQEYFKETGKEFRPNPGMINNVALDDLLDDATDEDLNTIRKNGLSLLKSTSKYVNISNQTRKILRALSKNYEYLLY